jgi:hypothetical protein
MISEVAMLVTTSVEGELTMIMTSTQARNKSVMYPVTGAQGIR